MRGRGSQSTPAAYLETALRRPAGYPAGGAAWFRRLAETLLTRVELVAGDAVCRPAEVEVYDFTPGHPDPFAHRHPAQLVAGAWYLHRVGTGYRGGSYKGIDLAFGVPGPEPAYSGVLIRALGLADGSRIDGPSRVVDHLLRATGHATPAALDAAIGGRRAWDAAGPIRLRDAAPIAVDLLATPRVGLSLRRHTPATMAVALDYLFRRYRFVADPRRTRTGKPHLAATLLLNGEAVAEVTARTGVPPAAVRRYQQALAGARHVEPAGHLGRPLTSAEWVTLYGWWAGQRHEETDIPPSLGAPPRVGSP